MLLHMKIMYNDGKKECWMKYSCEKSINRALASHNKLFLNW